GKFTKTEDNPGPGTYNLQDLHAVGSNQRSKIPRQAGERQRQGGLVVCSKTAPSVPDQAVQTEEIMREKLQMEGGDFVGSKKYGDHGVFGKLSRYLCTQVCGQADEELLQ
ncbi:unnamed protein product, partial [Amoebophrya sp. A25]